MVSACTTLSSLFMRLTSMGQNMGQGGTPGLGLGFLQSCPVPCFVSTRFNTSATCAAVYVNPFVTAGLTELITAGRWLRTEGVNFVTAKLHDKSCD